MELTGYIIIVIISIVLFAALCLIGKQLKEYIVKHHVRFFNANEYFPKEELLSLQQVYYLILILVIYFCITNFFFNKFSTFSNEILIVNSLIDILFSAYLIVTFYDGSRRSNIINIFLMPLASISYLLIGPSVFGYWDFIRIPTLLYLVVYYYNKFRDFTDRHQLGKLILLLLTIIFFCLVITMIVENQNPLNSLAMVSNAITSNGYAVLGETTLGVVTDIFLVWSGYIISGVATATLTAAIIQRKSNKKFEKLEDKIDRLEKIIIEYQEKE